MGTAEIIALRCILMELCRSRLRSGDQIGISMDEEMLCCQWKWSFVLF